MAERMTAMTLFRTTAMCPQCGHTGFADLESRLGDRGRTYVLGDSVEGDFALHDFEETSFVVRMPARDEPVRFLSYWICRACLGGTFAELVITHDRVHAIASLELSLAVLDRLHFISEDVEDMLQPIADGSLYTDIGLRTDWLAALRQGLEAGRRWPREP